MNGLCFRAAGAEEIVLPRRLAGVVVRPLNFTVRAPCTPSMLFLRSSVFLPVYAFGQY